MTFQYYLKISESAFSSDWLASSCYRLHHSFRDGNNFSFVQGYVRSTLSYKKGTRLEGIHLINIAILNMLSRKSSDMHENKVLEMELSGINHDQALHTPAGRTLPTFKQSCIKENQWSPRKKNDPSPLIFFFFLRRLTCLARRPECLRKKVSFHFSHPSTELL